MASDWKVSTLGELAEIVMGQSPKGTDCNSDGHGTPLLNGPTEFGSNHPYPTQFTTDPKRFSKKDDLLFCVRGSTTGRMNWSDKEYAIGRGLAAFRHKKGKDFQSFLKGIIDIKLPELLASATGSTFPNVSKNQLNDLEVILPPLTEQKAIAHILGSLDDKIELNRQMNETLEAMAQALFKSWFVDFDPVIDNALAAGNAIPDEFAERAEQRKGIEKKDNSDIQALFPDEFEFTEEMGWIPKGWAVSNVGTEFDVTMGQSPPGSTYNEIEEGIYFFQGSTDFGFRYPTPRIYCTEPKRLANKRDTLVSVRAPVGDTNLAAVDCCIGRGLAALRHKSGSASFTYYAMLQLKENFKIYEGEGTVFGSINQKDFKNLIQLKSPEVLISEFEINAGALDSKIELNSLNIITLAKLRDTLLPKLMSGKLRIADAEALVEHV